MLRKILIAALLLAATAFAASPTVWQNGEFYLWNYPTASAISKPFSSPGDFCFALRYENKKIGNPECYEAGDFERDSSFTLYAKWLNANLDYRLSPEDLKPRNNNVISRLGSLKDKMLLYSTIRNDSLWMLLFDETSSEPQKIATFPLLAYPARADTSEILREIANDWFGSSPQRRLSDEERERKAKEPDSYFAKQPMHDVWLGLSAGYAQAKVPLTPNSWYKNKLNSKVKNYREPSSGDSSSAWSFLDDKTPVYSAYLGGSIYDFIGLEFAFRYSKHNVKIDGTLNSAYEELDYWYFNRYEFLLSLMFMHAFHPYSFIEVKPHASFGVLYSIYREHINLKDGDAMSPTAFYHYENRFGFENYYRGAIFSLGVRAAFYKNYALDLRAGLMTRGRSNAAAPSGDAAPSPSVIGSSTTDAFISAGIEYHIRWR